MKCFPILSNRSLCIESLYQEWSAERHSVRYLAVSLHIEVLPLLGYAAVGYGRLTIYPQQCHWVNTQTSGLVRNSLILSTVATRKEVHYMCRNTWQFILVLISSNTVSLSLSVSRFLKIKTNCSFKLMTFYFIIVHVFMSHNQYKWSFIFVTDVSVRVVFKKWD